MAGITPLGTGKPAHPPRRDILRPGGVMVCSSDSRIVSAVVRPFLLVEGVAFRIPVEGQWWVLFLRSGQLISRSEERRAWWYCAALWVVGERLYGGDVLLERGGCFCLLRRLWALLAGLVEFLYVARLLDAAALALARIVLSGGGSPIDEAPSFVVFWLHHRSPRVGCDPLPIWKVVPTSV